MLLEGAGLIDVNRADDPLALHRPAVALVPLPEREQGRRLPDAARHRRRRRRRRSGRGRSSSQPQSATAGATIDLPATATVAPGGYAAFTAVARASAEAAAGDDYGFIVLRRGTVTRRIPYAFTVERPGLESVTPKKLASFQIGDTRKGESKVSSYRWPAAPFGPPPSYTGPPLDENGAEQLYVTELAQPAVNMGVAVILAERRLADRPLLPRLARRERRHRLHGHAGERERLHVRLPRRRAGGRHPVPAAGAVLRRGRLRARATSPARASPASTCCTPG